MSQESSYLKRVWSQLQLINNLVHMSWLSLFQCMEVSSISIWIDYFLETYHQTVQSLSPTETQVPLQQSRFFIFYRFLIIFRTNHRYLESCSILLVPRFELQSCTILLLHWSDPMKSNFPVITAMPKNFSSDTVNSFPYMKEGACADIPCSQSYIERAPFCVMSSSDPIASSKRHIGCTLVVSEYAEHFLL